MNMQNQINSIDLFVISNNGKLDLVSFKTSKEAETYINDNYDENDQYLLKIVKMKDYKYCGLLTIQRFSNDAKQAQEILDAIEQSDNQDFIYQQLANCEAENWINHLYFDHFKKSILEYGYYDSDESYQDSTLKSYKDFLKKLRKDIDYHEDYDAAFAKYNK